MTTKVKLIAPGVITPSELTLTTASGGTNTTAPATTAFVQQEISSLVDSSPGALNTLNELAAALGDDANFSTTVTNSIATKLPLAGGTITGTTIITGTAGRGLVLSNATESYTNNVAVINAQHSQGILQFKTANTERMRIDKDGNVGIGTAGAAKLRQLDLKNTSHSLMAISAGSGGHAGVFYYDGTTEMFNQYYDTSSDKFILSSSAVANQFVIDRAAGNVGIGQPSPTHKLHVKKDNDYAAKFGGTGGGDYSIEIGQGTTNSSAGFNATGSSGSMLFKISDSEKMRIKYDGNVGIGTNNPGSKLTVEGDIRQTTGDLLYTGGGNWNIRHLANDQNITFDTTTGSTTSEKMRIRGDGNVGIGTTSLDSITSTVATLSLGGINAGTSGGIAYQTNGTSEAYHYTNADFLLHQALSGIGQRFLTNNTERMRIESGGNVGIGTTSPSHKLHVSSTARFELTNGGLVITKTSGGASTNSDYMSALMRTDTAGYHVTTNNGGFASTANALALMNHGDLILATAPATGSSSNYTTGRVMILAGGNVGVGTAAPTERLHVDGVIASQNSGQGAGQLQLQGYGNSAYINHNGSGALIFRMGSGFSERFRIGATGTLTSYVNGTMANLILNNEADTPYMAFMESAAAKFFIGESSVVGGGGGYDIYATTGKGITFFTNSTRKMDITSSGTLLVGKTSTAIGTAGIELTHDNVILGTRSGGVTQYLNRLSSDGDIIQYMKDGTTIGSIGAVASQLYIAAGDTGLQLNGTADQIRPCAGDGAARDAAIDLGDATRRFKDLYLGGQTLVTGGALSAPSYSFIGNTNTGISRPTTNAVNIVTGGQERVRFDASGNLLVGTSNLTWQSQEGLRYFNGSSLIITRDSDEPMSLNRLTNDGDLLILRKDGTTVGSIASLSGDILIGTGNTGLRFYDAGKAIQPRNTDGSTARGSDAISLGMSDDPFKDLHLSGTVNAVQLDITAGTDAKIYTSNSISEVGSGIFAIQSVNTAGSALKPLGFRAEDIRFATGSAERLRIDSSGNVGIGTTSPSARLDVVANSTVWAGEFTQSNTSNGDGLFVSVGSTAAADYALSVRSNGGNHSGLAVKADGNVGIGTFTPASTLAISNLDNGTSFSSNRVLQLIGTSTTDGSRVSLAFSGNTNIGNGLAIIEAVNDDQSAGHTSLHMHTYNGSWNTENLVLKGGNVGIGTSSPGSYKLNVNGETKTLGLYSAGTTNLGTNGHNGSDKTILAGYGVLAGNGTRYGNYGSLIFKSSSAYTAGARSFLITNGYDSGSKFAIIQSSTHTTIPDIDGAGGGATNGTPVLVIDNSGDVHLSDNLVMSSGKGISFAAGSNYSGMTSEILDDYEEGTWTPTIVGYGQATPHSQTYSVQTGNYTKVGNLVTAHFFVTLSNKGNIASASGNYSFIKGLPFTHAGSVAGTGVMWGWQALTNAVSHVAADMSSTNTQAWLTQLQGTSAAGTSYMGTSQITNTTSFRGTLIYKAS